MKKITIDDPESKSADQIAANVEQLKSLFPEAFTEGKIDFEVLKGASRRRGRRAAGKIRT